MSKNFWDLKHVSSVTAIALLWEGKPAGKIVANWSDNPAGSVCTALVLIHEGPLASIVGDKFCGSIGKAGGYGYDKLSTAIEDALLRAKWHGGYDDKGDNLPHKVLSNEGKRVIDIAPVMGGTGNQREVFERLGYTWVSVIGWPCGGTLCRP